MHETDPQLAPARDVHGQHLRLAEARVLRLDRALPAEVVAVPLHGHHRRDLLQPVDDVGYHEVAAVHDEIYTAERFVHLRPEFLPRDGNVGVRDKADAHRPHAIRAHNVERYL